MPSTPAIYAQLKIGSQDITRDYLQIIDLASGEIIGWIDSAGVPWGTLQAIGSFWGSPVIPSGTIPGTVYTVDPAPTAGFIVLIQNGLILTPGEDYDYTLDGSTITLATATEAGDTLAAYYP